jgi:hypothetical protein
VSGKQTSEKLIQDLALGQSFRAFCGVDGNVSEERRYVP